MIDYKIVLCGDFGVGKTALAQRACRGIFNDTTGSTIGASYFCWTCPKTNRRCAIWDTAGQERYNSLLPMYFRGAHAVIYCIDNTVALDRRLISNLLETVKHASEDCLHYFVFTKCDLNSAKNSLGEELGKEYNITDHFYTSAKLGDGIPELFDSISTNLCKISTVKNINILQSARDPLQDLYVWPFAKKYPTCC